jgi:hypothetical protein
MIPLIFLLASSSPPPAVDAAVPRPLRLAVTSSSAFGVTHAKFFNQLLGARLEYRFSPRFAFGGAVSYANLKGKEERVHNVLPEATSEYRVAAVGESVALPLRISFGYLPQNGPTLRLGAALAVTLTDAVSLELVPLEPMIWVTRERPEVSLNGTLALRAAF